MSAPSDDSARTALVVAAWKLATGHHENHPGKRLSTYQIADELGISQASASRYVREGNDGAAWIDLLEHAEGRLAMAERLGKYLGWIDDEASRRDAAAGGNADKTDLIKPALAVEERLAKLAGYDEPVRTRNENVAAAQSAPNPKVAAAIRDEQRRNARECAAINGEVVDGSDE